MNPEDPARFQYAGRDLEAMAEARYYREWVLSRLRPYLGNDAAEVGAGSGEFTTYLAREVRRYALPRLPQPEPALALAGAGASVADDDKKAWGIIEID